MHPVHLAFAALIIWPTVVLHPAAGADPAWEPARTWVFAVGLVEWESNSYASFPKKNRQDVELINTLSRRGVPESQIVFLKDQQATTQRITEEFKQFVQSPKPGDWLFLYVSGHGFNSTDHKQTYFASYDADGKNIGVRLGWFVEMAEKQFKGQCMMIAADHCCSGGFAESVKAIQPSKNKYAVFCSAHVNSKSTGNWTFTEGLIHGFQGRRWMDDDGDGSVTFRELAVNIAEDMAFAEDQMAQFTMSSSLDRDTLLAKANAEPASQVGDRVEILSAGQWYRGLIVNADGKHVRVHYYGWAKSDDEWVTERHIRRVEKKTMPVGTKVRGLSSGKWYPGEVVAVRLGLHLVKFDGWEQEWNEWVPYEKLRSL